MCVCWCVSVSVIVVKSFSYARGFDAGLLQWPRALSDEINKNYKKIKLRAIINFVKKQTKQVNSEETSCTSS